MNPIDITVTDENYENIADTLSACINVARAETGLHVTTIVALLIVQAAHLLADYSPAEAGRILDLTSDVIGADPDEAAAVEARNQVEACDAMARLAAIEGAEDQNTPTVRLS